MEPDQVVVVSVMERLCDTYGVKTVALLLGVNWRSVSRWRAGAGRIGRDHAWKLIELSRLTPESMQETIHFHVQARQTGIY